METARRNTKPVTDPQRARTGVRPERVARPCAASRHPGNQHLSGSSVTVLPMPATHPRSSGKRGGVVRESSTDGGDAIHALPGTIADDRSAAWLRAATAGLAVLAAAAAAVSFSAQYRMIFAAKQQPAVAGLEAAIPDAAALVFASLGIALALHGRRAVRARLLNVAAVGTSVFMNVLAAAPGWRGAAIWAMPPVAYALASDTMIGVVRARALRRRQTTSAQLAEDEATPLALAGGALLWLLRLILAPASTAAGFRRWVLEECPVAPGRPARLVPETRTSARSVGARSISRGSGTKTARFLALVQQRHGPLAGIPLTDVSRICTAIARRG